MGDASIRQFSFENFKNVVGDGLRDSSAHHNGINPSDKSLLWDVPIASEADLNDAVKVAQTAFKTWSRSTWESRSLALAHMRDELSKYREEMGKLLMLEAGKPMPFALGEVDASIHTLDFHVKQEELKPEVIQEDAELKLTMRYFPMGVTGAICPWNFPLVLAMGKISAALLTGNCMIVKTSPYTPYTTLKFVEICQQFLPPGVLQGLNGDDKLGPWMTEHPGIEKISFTGSTATGKRVLMSAAKTLKRVTLELGGNSACIVCPDVDVKKVAPLVALGAFYHSSQICVATKRLYVHKDIYEEMKKALVDVVKSWKVGPATDAMLGPVQNEMQYNIVKTFFEDCAVNGYDFALGGKMGDGAGYVIEPAIVDNPPDDSKIVREEPFGPIVPMMMWDDEEEMLARVNDTRTGLGGSVYGVDGERIASRIEAGTVWVNSFERPLAEGYFSGWKESGLGGELGRKGLEGYLNVQVMHTYKG